MRKEDDRFSPIHEGDREPLFVTRRRTGGVIAFRVFAASVFGCICWIWFYRMTIPVEIDENRTGFARLIWWVMLSLEIWFGLYWAIIQSLRWNPVWRFTFADRLSRRYGSNLPKLDVFVCTADPVIEPPLMVVNTVLSVAALDYPPDKLAVYLSDDGGSELTFYALAEAAEFAKIWVPFSKRFNVEPRSPAAYLSSKANGIDSAAAEEVAELYREMAARIETATKLRRVPEEARLKYGDGFSQWDSDATQRNHGTILQILVDGRKEKTVTVPTLVYLSREKRPQHHHNFKAGSMNALIRVSSKITCGRFILNLDCDMYSNNSKSARDALCILLDEKEGKEIAFVQFPQCYNNITRNDLYGSTMLVIADVEFNGLDGNGGPLYVGTGCFHRRDVICGRKYGAEEEDEYEEIQEISEPEMIKALASCTYDENSQWGKEMGLKYGCPVEDVITGLAIQCRGWKSAYLTPKDKAFVGVAPTNLHQMLVQQRRWSEGDFQILLSEYSPVWYGQGKIGLGLILGYCCYCLWAPSSVPLLLYSVLTSLCLLKGIPLFPKVRSSWFIPFGYVTVAVNAYSLAEFLWCGGTFRGWWNEQRMWLYRRTSSFLFGFIDTILKKLGVSESAFVITAKVAEEEAAERYEKEVMEFGVESPMFVLLGTLGMLNLFCFAAAVMRLVTFRDRGGDFQTMGLQFLITGLLVAINWPLYEAMLLRKDRGKMPVSVTVKSVVFALSACTCIAFL
uniref:Cellulose synthase-like protein E1 n=1 Tax=Noccaea caerulescens TaxID=107243 RepID=A0A1J3DDT0_NOCCA